MTRFKTFDEAATKGHPSDDIHHEITWWITRPMTLDEWIKLDDEMNKAFAVTFGESFDGYMGIAGPIPEVGEKEARS